MGKHKFHHFCTSLETFLEKSTGGPPPAKIPSDAHECIQGGGSRKLGLLFKIFYKIELLLYHSAVEEKLRLRTAIVDIQQYR